MPSIISIVYISHKVIKTVLRRIQYNQTFENCFGYLRNAAILAYPQVVLVNQISKED